MENNEEDDDLKLAQASASFLSDLESSLPKMLWEPSKSGRGHGPVHSQVRQQDLDYTIKLIEPFQSEPQLLDARLKSILPPLVEALLEYLQSKPRIKSRKHVEFQAAASTILYTLCKVRGAKVIVGFFNNEPRYLELILARLERASSSDEREGTDWKVTYILLLWLSHLLLTPFDLSTISSGEVPEGLDLGLNVHHELPPVAYRIVAIAFQHLGSSTKAQDAAAALLARLALRPDMHKLRLGDGLAEHAINALNLSSETTGTIYEYLGPLRFLAGIASSADLGHLVPSIYRACEKIAQESSDHPVSSNAVGKKITVKIFRNIAIVCLRSASGSGPLLSFLETTSVLEDVIDHLLRSLGDRDTPVRFAAAKAISLIVLELDPEMGHEVIQAVLETFKEDMPRNSSSMDYRTVNALKWHGLTLTLSHTLFKRSASVEQLADIVEALVSALNFEQRTATGSSVGANVRDAANFGIWSVSRRYNTSELHSVDTASLRFFVRSTGSASVIQALATQLLLSSCLDPAGNIRRGSSAALQELIGRHPNQVHEGISLVQAVDYQAVGLRKRAMVEVAGRAADLHTTYWQALVVGLLGWRGLGSADVPSREAAAESLARLAHSRTKEGLHFVTEKLVAQTGACSSSDYEMLHGLVLSLARIVSDARSEDDLSTATGPLRRLWKAVSATGILTVDFSLRVLQSRLPPAIADLASCIMQRESDHTIDATAETTDLDGIDEFVDRLLARQENAILGAVPFLVKMLLRAKQTTNASYRCIDVQALSHKVLSDGSKTTLQGAGRAITLGALAAEYEQQHDGQKARTAIETLANLSKSSSVDWRVMALRAMKLAIDGRHDTVISQDVGSVIVQAVERGLNDYTIDERGDIGSLVRLQALACTQTLLANGTLSHDSHEPRILQANVLRLSLEKLDRVRLLAAQCRHDLNSIPGISWATGDYTDISSFSYLTDAFRPLWSPETPPWVQRALLEGCISCAGGTSAESLLQSSRQIIAEGIFALDLAHLQDVLSVFSAILKDMLLDNASTTNMPSALDVLAFLLEMRILQRLAPSGSATAKIDFKWRNLLSTVQKAHHKSNDIPKILTAVRVYVGLAEIDAIRTEVLKKLVGMIKTNPYPKIRMAVAEALFVVVDENELKDKDWTRPPSQLAGTVKALQEKYITV